MKTIYCDLKMGMTKDAFLKKCSGYPERTPSIIEVGFDSEEDMKEFDSQCMCFAEKKVADPDGGPNGEGNYYIHYAFEDFDELERNISYMVLNHGWSEEDY